VQQFIAHLGWAPDFIRSKHHLPSAKETEDAVPALSTPPVLPALASHEFLVRTVVSFTVLGCAIYVILSARFTPTEKNWAFGITGTILGYWLRK